MIEITIKGDLKENTALVFTVQERQASASTGVVFGACEIDEIVSVIQKRLPASQESESRKPLP